MSARRFLPTLLCLLLLAAARAQPKLQLRPPQKDADFFTADSSGRTGLSLSEGVLYQWDLRSGLCLRQRSAGGKVSHIRQEPGGRWLALLTRTGAASYLRVYNTADLEEVAHLRVDSVLKARGAWSAEIKDLALDGAHNRVGIAAISHLLQYDWLANTISVKPLPQYAQYLAPLGGDWLIALLPEGGKTPLCRTDARPASPVVSSGSLPTADYLQGLAPAADGAYVLAFTAGKAFRIGASNGVQPCIPPDDPYAFLELKNYDWQRRQLYVSSRGKTFRYEAATNSFTAIGYKVGQRPHTDGFARPLPGGQGLLLRPGAAVVDSFLYDNEAQYLLQTAAPLGNPRLVSPWSFEPAGGTRYLVRDGASYFLLDLDNLSAAPCPGAQLPEWQTLKKWPRPEGGYCELLGHSNGVYGDGFRQALVATEHDAADSLVNAFDVGTTGISTFAYPSLSGQTLYVFDGGQKQFFRARRDSKKAVPAPLPITGPVYAGKAATLYAALPGEDFLVAGKELLRYKAAEGTFQKVDATTHYDGFSILTPIPQGDAVFYVGRDSQYAAWPELKRYRYASDSTDVVLHNVVQIGGLVAGRYAGRPCWYVALRDDAWELRAYSEDFSQVLARLPIDPYIDVKGLQYNREKDLLLLLQGFALQVLDAAKGTEAARLYFSQARFLSAPVQVLAFAPNNHYYVPSREAESLNWTYNGEAWPFLAFDRFYNDPVYLLRTLRSKDSLLLQTLAKASALRQKRLGKAAAPDALAQLPVARFRAAELPFSVDTTVVEIPVVLRATRKKILRLELRVNNVPEPEPVWLEAPVLPGTERRLTVPVRIDRGARSLLGLRAVDEDGNASIADELPLYCRGYEDRSRPRTWYLGIGLSQYADSRFNLRFAAKDAQDIAGHFTRAEGIRMGKTRVLTDTAVTAAGIREALGWLAARVQREDILIVSFSGHGVSLGGRFYLTLHGTDFGNVAGSAFPFDSLSLALRRIACRKKLLLIDACASGDRDSDGELQKLAPVPTVVVNGARGIKVPGSSGAGEAAYLNLMKEYFADMGDESGATVIAATTGTSVAFEDEHYGNGAFTYAFLKGYFEGAADANGDGKLTLSELSAWLSTEVRRITNGYQQPSLRSIDLRNDWELYLPD